MGRQRICRTLALAAMVAIGGALLASPAGANRGGREGPRAAAIRAFELRLHLRAPETVTPQSGAPSATIGFLPAVQVGNMPQAAAFDPATDTVYVANQSDNTVSVVDARHCNALDTSGCDRAPVTVPVGAGPFSFAIDDRTHTVYVANQNDNTVSVINGKTCNATNTSGCSATPPTVAAGPTPFGIAIDPGSDTLYVADANFDANNNPQAGSVSMINGATCNASVTSGCGQQPALVPVGHFAFTPFFDPATGTVYVTNANDNTISMIDARTCNATDSAGCGHVATVATASNPIPVLVDDRTGTLYVGSANSPNVDVVDARTCNAERTSGCGALGSVAIAGGTDGMAIDERTDTLFVANNGPGTSPAMGDSVSVIDASTCNALNTAGCGQNAPTVLTGASPGGNTIDPATDTLYVTTFDNTLEVINGATCNEHVRTGCGQPVPATLAGKDPISIAINQSTSSVYIGDSSQFEGVPDALTVLDDATCNTHEQSGCTVNPTSFTTPFDPLGLAVDPPTDTLYAAFSFDTNVSPNDTVGVIDGSTCNATDSAGCGPVAASATVGNVPFNVAIDRATHTAYVANAGDGTVSLFDTSACNATDTAGCGPAAATVTLGQSPNSIAVDQATDTIYTWNANGPGTVSVIDGATCNASNTSGCVNTPPSIPIGNSNGGLSGIAINDATDTVYALNTADDTVSVIDGATCNASVTSGCGQIAPTAPVGGQIYGGIAVDSARNLVYVANGLGDTVSVIDGSTCDGADTTGCGRTPPTVPGGPAPAAIALNPLDGTAYVVDNGGGVASFFRFVTPDEPTDVGARRSGDDISLRWRPAYDGGLPIIYQVIPTPACPECSGLTTSATSGIPATTISGLTQGRTYTFRVKGIDAAGTGPPSDPSTPITP